MTSNVAKYTNSLRNTKKNCNLPHLQIFEIRQMHKLSEEYEKNLPLSKMQISERRKIAPKITEYADSWINKDISRQSPNSRNVPIRGEK